MTEEEFWVQVAATHMEHPEWRLGQTIFNVLYFNRPDLSEQIRGTNLDPFREVSPTSLVVVECTKWIHENW